MKVFPIQTGGANSYFYPGANPGEGYLNTNSQLVGTVQAPVPIVPSTNQGFVTNFSYTLGWESAEKSAVIAGTSPSQIMGIYTPALLPILSNLASGYAVCDQWFASAATETLPNRAFVHQATSQDTFRIRRPRCFWRRAFIQHWGKRELAGVFMAIMLRL